MGRARNLRNNPNPSEPSFRLNNKQLQTRFVITAGKILGALLLLGPATVKGPRTMLISSDGEGSLSLNIGWRWREEDADERPDLVIRFTPEVSRDPKTGDDLAQMKVEDFYHELCPNKDELREKVGECLAKAQIEMSDAAMMSRTRREAWV